MPAQKADKSEGSLFVFFFQKENAELELRHNSECLTALP